MRKNVASPVICKRMGLLYSTHQNWMRESDWANEARAEKPATTVLWWSGLIWMMSFLGQVKHRGTRNTIIFISSRRTGQKSFECRVCSSTQCCCECVGVGSVQAADRALQCPISVIVAKEAARHVLGTSVWYLCYMSYSWLYSLKW